MPRSFVLAGAYPRREDLVKATWDFDKGLLNAAQLDERFLDQAREVVAFQETLGASPVTDGNLTWQDTFRGLVASASGFEVGGVTRLFETNKFYRQPILTGRPVLNKEAFTKHLLLERLGVKAAKKAILPSPYWLLRASKVETPPASPEDALVAGLVREAAQHVASLGYSEIQFQEPLLFYEEAPDLGLAAELIAAATKGLPGRTVVNFANGDAAEHLAWAAKLPVSAVGIDLVETHVDELATPAKAKLDLLAAVVDSQESLLEAGEDVEALAQAVEKRLKPARLTLTHTWDLEFLPATVAARKLELLARATAREVAA